jgi:predicted dehydrogenase
MTQHDTVNIGIIGLGRAGAIHFDALQRLAAARVVAVCDAAVEARRRAEGAGIESFPTLDAMLEEVPLDGVIVCTPPAGHAEISLRCLARGLHVLCEKPLALTTWDVLTMLQAANRERRNVLVASKFRHVPEIRRARALINEGVLGELVSFEVTFCSPVDMAGRWNAQRALSGGGVIIDNGCHAFDLIAFLFGGIRRVHATRLKGLQPIDVEDSATLQLWTDGGVVGRVDLSWSLAAARDSYLVVHGSHGVLEVGWRGTRLKRADGDWAALGGPYDKIAAHCAMHERFVGSIGNGTEPWISAAECLQSVAAVDAAYRSLASGIAEWVAIQGARELDLISLSAPPAYEGLRAVAH